MSFSHGSSRFSKISARVNRQFTHAGHAKASAVPFVSGTFCAQHPKGEFLAKGT